jgi:hypothetical protein
MAQVEESLQISLLAASPLSSFFFVAFAQFVVPLVSVSFYDTRRHGYELCAALRPFFVEVECISYLEDDVW